MSTMPTREQYPDFMKYIQANREWEETTDEGKAYVIDRKRKQEEEARVEAERFKAALSPAQASYLDHLGIPARALVASRGALEDTEAIAAARGATDFLVLSGGPGCGKTVASVVWIADYVSDPKMWGKSSLYGNDRPEFKGGTPIWITAAKLARCDRYDESNMMKLLRTPRLVVDDLGGEYLDKSGFYASLLDEIVNERQAESKPTIMTTNLNAEAFKERYGERIIDRIREGGRFVGCGDHSLRSKKDAP